MSLLYPGQQHETGQDDDVRAQMANGALLATDWGVNIGGLAVPCAVMYDAEEGGNFQAFDKLLHQSWARRHCTLPPSTVIAPPQSCCCVPLSSGTKVDKTRLGMAASEGHSIALDLLMRNGANINAKDMPKMTALHWVAQRSHREVAELPLRYEADIHCLSKFHETPLDIAMDTGNTELMMLPQDGIQNQININSDSHNIIPAGGPLNPSELITTTKTTAGKTVDGSTAQNVVGDSGRRVITAVTDQRGSLQPAALGEQFIVTLQGQQSEWVIGALQCPPGPN